jgi:hypothetical protein
MSGVPTGQPGIRALRSGLPLPALVLTVACGWREEGKLVVEEEVGSGMWGGTGA